jgi:hypothetical protein
VIWVFTKFTDLESFEKGKNWETHFSKWFWGQKTDLGARGIPSQGVTCAASPWQFGSAQVDEYIARLRNSVPKQQMVAECEQLEGFWKYPLVI